MKCEFCKKTIKETNTILIGDIEWSSTLLSDGSSKTQAEWNNWCSNTVYRLPTQAEYVAAVRWFLQQPDSSEKQSFFADLRDHWLMTSETLPCLDGVERALVLGVFGNYRFYVVADDDINGNWPARGVVVKKKKKRKL